MAAKKRRRTTKRKFNPTGLETGLLATGAAVVGAVGGFMLASYGCSKLIKSGIDSGMIEPGPTAGPMAREAMGAPGY